MNASSLTFPWWTVCTTSTPAKDQKNERWRQGKRASLNWIKAGRQVRQLGHKAPGVLSLTPDLPGGWVRLDRLENNCLSRKDGAYTMRYRDQSPHTKAGVGFTQQMLFEQWKLHSTNNPVASKPFPRHRACAGKEGGTHSATHQQLGKQTHHRLAANAVKKAEFTLLRIASFPGSVLLVAKETSWDTLKNL